MLRIQQKKRLIFIIFFILVSIFITLFLNGFISITLTTSQAERGNIIDKNGFILATNKNVDSLYYLPNTNCPTSQETAKLEDFVSEFSSLFHRNISITNINKRLKETCRDLNKKPILLYSNLTEQELSFINKNRFHNLSVQSESIRIYPQHEVGSQVIGYVENNDFPSTRVGVNGIERQYEEELKGTLEKRIVLQINKKQYFWRIQNKERGKDIQLSLDSKLQQKVEEALKSQLQLTQNRAEGYAVAMNVKTGNILAMANSSTFDPNILSMEDSVSKNEQLKVLAQNKTIQKIKYDDSYINMGSTIKPLTILIGLNEKLFEPLDTYVDHGDFQYDNQNDVKNELGTPTGEITPSQAIINSSNTFMTAKVAIPLLNKNNGSIEKVASAWTNYLEQFGLRSKTGIDLPFEEEDKYVLRSNMKFEHGLSALLNASWGGNEVHTPLQLAQYAATIANKGIKYKPQVATTILNDHGKIEKPLQPIVESSNHYPASFWTVLQNGMNNHIQEMKDLPFDVTGKTGTTSSPNKDGTVVNHSLFIAYAPTNDPEIAISVVIPGGGLGANSAAPVAANILKAWDALHNKETGSTQ
ncbi:penicillin-binding protein 2 [Bacillus clarus]|uniref:serine-type D-Ala-D-Ala carboxypeptidase n=1 Tax=Bacillus clarus TaxID=2338372 RepID=A0A090YWE5_9BACI|nr:penicillin-binding protein 2 [Bacillus clarus]KFN02597.1 penicillin binding transpeptidase domain protein [Bacillus clarus]RFT65127.1 penicillin-binding protein 2 [Bacillus clarus]